MIPVSDDFKKFIYSLGRELLVKIEADLADGTHLTLSSYDLMESGFEIEDAVSESGRFQVGAAIINQLTLELNNFADKTQGNDLSGVDFTGAVLRPCVGLVVKKDWHGDTVEWVPKGVFTAEKPTAAGGRTTVTALDNMAKLDVAYSKSALKYPATLGQIATDTCSVCGATLATTTFPNSAYSVAKRPTEESITCREMLAYVAQLAGCFARCNTAGAVEIRWYTDSDTPYDVGAGATSSGVADADTVIAGVQIQGTDDTVYSSGVDGFAVRIQDNPLAQDGLQAVADTLGTKFNGYTFRAYTASALSNPAIEAGDVVNMTDSKGVTRKTIVSRLTYSLGNAEEYNADAETAAENQSKRFTAAQKAQEVADTAQQTADEAKDGVAKAEIKIGDLEITITGKVSFSDLENAGQTVINGSNITTGRIESRDGSWWIDLDSGKVYMQDGTFAGTIQWADGSYIKHDSSSTQIYAKGALQISSGNGGGGDLYLNGSESAGGGTGIAHCHYLSAYSLEAGAGGIYSSSGIIAGGTLAGSSLQIGGHTFSVTRMTTGDGHIYNALLESTS